MRIFIIAAAALLLSGCVTIAPKSTAQPEDMAISQTIPKGRYADYQAFLTEQGSHMGFAGPVDIPEDLQQQTRDCLVKLTIANLTPSELDTLNAYARGDKAMSQQELSSMGDVIKNRAGSTDAAMLASLKDICPDTIDRLTSLGVGSDFKLVYVP